MADKFIPPGEADFAKKARHWAASIGGAPERFGVLRADANALVQAYEEFQALRLKASNRYTSSQQLRHQRDGARSKVKRIMERLGRIIRANDQLDCATAALLGIRNRPTRLRASRCPQTRPELFYVGSRHSRRVGRKVHVLRFEEPWTKIGDPMCRRRMAKPDGAWGVAVYVELIGEGETIPKHPGELSGGRPWLLQLCTRGPIEAEFPVADRPMRVVYWARWVGKKGDMGPFSQTCVGEFEGEQFGRKALVDQTIARRRAQSIVITTAWKELPEPVEQVDALPGAGGQEGAEQRLLNFTG